MTTTLWTATFLLPLLVAAGLGILATSRVIGEVGGRAIGGVSVLLVRLAPLTCLPAILLTVAPGAGGGIPIDVPWLLVGTHLELDALGRPLVLVSALLYGSALAAVAWTATDRSRDLVAFLLICHTGTTAVFTAADAVTFYLGYAVMSFAAYGLVVHYRTESAMRAGRVYLVLTVVSETAILAAILMVAAAGGTRLADAPAAVAAAPNTGVIVALLLVGFGVKAGTLPLHVWLPLAHPAAPPAASAVLSGAMVKAGLVGWLRFLPLGEVALPGWGLTLVLLALGGAFLAVPAGELQKDPKVVLAYSTISQMGFLAALVGVALAAPELAPAVAPAAVTYAVHHALAKGALFLGVPVWKHHARGVRRWIVVVGLVGAGLAVAGAPFSSGSVGKYAAKSAVGEATVLGMDLVTLLPLIATGSTLLLLRFGWLLAHGEPETRRRGDAELAAWLVLVAGGITLPWIVTDLWLPVGTVPGLDAVTLWDATWPILLGLAIGGLAWWLSARDILPGWAAHPDGRTVPPGDLVVPEERLVRSAMAFTRSAAVGPRRVIEQAAARLTAHHPADRAGRGVDTIEALLRSRAGRGLLLLGLATVLVAAEVAS
ncbi:formate hydrogenlyase [Dietzia sp. UCD-THP]|uniref:Formate hydrogenlyase n=1 Tax=Dietzia natronolimnaea TaxID=161920 RepID=A0A2A2WQS3_9ACTN|nr:MULTISPECIES: proton-conducting transporter membrane subunit [Dietzia]EYT65236.1 formate hydrogenlyase [Dietzia sp. UCD-THP]PAY23538.1 formate hydrogenlyase [Dietzia natronolimnaea]